MHASFDASESGLEIEERGRQPPLPLIAGLPVVNLARALFDQAVDRFDAVRRAQTDPKLVDHAESVQRECLLEAFVQGERRRLVEDQELAPERGQRRFGVLVGRLRVGPLELASPRRLLGLGQIRDDVLALVPPLFVKLPQTSSAVMA